MAPGSEVCPGELVTLRCKLHSPHLGLAWICQEGGAYRERLVFCSSGYIIPLECNQVTFYFLFPFCDDNSIMSGATYNATTEIGTLTCADPFDVSINSSLQFGAHGKCIYMYIVIHMIIMDFFHALTLYLIMLIPYTTCKYN